jgi:hypothetical protein
MNGPGSSPVADGSTQCHVVAPLWPLARAGYRALRGGFLDEVSSYGAVGCEEHTKGGLQPTGSSEAGHATVSLPSQPSVMTTGSSKGWLTMRLGKTGVAQCVDGQRRVVGAQEASQWRGCERGET